MATAKPVKKKTPRRQGENPQAPAAGAVCLLTSSEARRDWSSIAKRALAGERIAILIGKQAVALRPVDLTCVEREYGVSEDQLHDKAQEVLKRARKERASGKTGAGDNLL